MNALIELGKIESRYPSAAGVGYFAVRRFQWRPYICLVSSSLSLELGKGMLRTNPRLQTQNVAWLDPQPRRNLRGLHAYFAAACRGWE